MVPDPYRALGLSHDASQREIKDAYRKLALQLHPDRLTRQHASEAEVDEATTEFAKVAAAYSLLTDAVRKRDYDHIYKYGGFDDEEDIDSFLQRGAKLHQGRGTKRQQQHQNSTSSTSPSNDPTQKKSARGIGYRCTDHFAYILSQGKRASTSVAGVQIPSRLHMARPASGAGGFRLSFSSGQFSTTDAGAKKYISKTTQFVAGKKFTKVETTVVHPDGRKEILIEGDDYVERRTTPPTRTMPSNENVAPHGGDGDLPWYMEAWHGIKDKLTACYSPCLPVQ
jgi:curved DNA-binding protein CbpA